MSEKKDPTPEQVTQIRKMIEVDRIPIASVAKHFKAPSSRIYRWMKDNDIISTRAFSEVKTPDEVVFATYLETKSIKKTRLKTGTSEDRIKEIITARGMVKNGRTYVFPSDIKKREPITYIPPYREPRGIDRSAIERRVVTAPAWGYV